MPRRSRRVAPTQSHRRNRRERQPNVYMGSAPAESEHDPEGDEAFDDLDVGLAEVDEDAGTAAGADAPPARRGRPEQRRAARARRALGARNRAAVFTQNAPRELKKLGVMMAGTAVILVVLTVVLR